MNFNYKIEKSHYKLFVRNYIEYKFNVSRNKYVPKKETYFDIEFA